jgi:flagellar biosynthetic protein FliR
MMSALSISLPLDQVQLGLLIFARVLAILLSIPIFDTRNVPAIVKAGLAIALSVMLFPAVGESLFPPVLLLGPFMMALLTEILIGFIIGFGVKVMFASVQLAGQYCGVQMGLAMANVIDPFSESQGSLVSGFYNLFAVLIFLSLDAHHWFIYTIGETFRLVPPGGFEPLPGTFLELAGKGGEMFQMCLRVGAPVIAVLLITSFAFALIARTVPQMNVFIVAMPVKVAVGMIFMALSLPYLVGMLNGMFEILAGGVMQLFIDQR